MRKISEKIKYMLMALAIFLMIISIVAEKAPHRDAGAACIEALTYLPTLNDDISFEKNIYGFRYKGNTRNLIDRFVLFLGAYEKPILYFLAGAARKLPGKDKSVFLDVGSNTGHHSLFMSKYVGSVHAFDPYQPVMQRLEEAIKLNSVKNIHKIFSL